MGTPPKDGKGGIRTQSTRLGCCARLSHLRGRCLVFRRLHEIIREMRPSRALLRTKRAEGADFTTGVDMNHSLFRQQGHTRSTSRMSFSVLRERALICLRQSASHRAQNFQTLHKNIRPTVDRRLSWSNYTKKKNVSFAPKTM